MDDLMLDTEFLADSPDEISSRCHEAGFVRDRVVI